MSARDNLNKQQIPDFNTEQPEGQLRMFVPTHEIIDTYPKTDSSHWDGVHSPREQWEKPSKEYGGQSLRDHKLADRDQYGKAERIDENDDRRKQGLPKLPVYQSRKQMVDKGETPPLTLSHWAAGDTPALTNGHHRLAELEARGHTEIPVEYDIEPGYGKGDRLGKKRSR